MNQERDILITFLIVGLCILVMYTMTLVMLQQGVEEAESKVLYIIINADAGIK